MQHFNYNPNQEGIEIENDQEHINEEQVLEDINDKKDPADIGDVINTLLGEKVEAVCDEVASEVMAGGDNYSSGKGERGDTGRGPVQREGRGPKGVRRVTSLML